MIAPEPGIDEPPVCTVVTMPQGESGAVAEVAKLGVRGQERFLSRRTKAAVLTIEPAEFHSMDEALKRLARFLGHVPDWRELTSFLPEELRGEIFLRSALAATFAATLELARSGRIELRQDRAFGPIYLRSPASASALP